MDFFSRVTVALANAPVDEDLLLYARLLRDLGEGAPGFDFVHVLPPADELAARRTGPLVTHRDVLDSIRARVESRFGPRAGDRCAVPNGVPVDKLLEHVAESGSDLILVGHRREATGRRSLSRRLAMKAPCSVWMVPEGSPARIGRVVAAVDLSLPSAHALALASLVASRAGISEIVALHVRRPSALPEDDVDRAYRSAAFERFTAPIDLNGVALDQRIEESGSVTAAVLRIAADTEADLIVMGTRGASPSAAVLLGSHTEEMLAEAEIPVLVTKDRGERIGVLKALLDRDFRKSDELRFG